MLNQTMILEDGSTLILVHFVYQSPRGTTQSEGEPLTPEKTWKVACAPNMVEIAAQTTRSFPYQRTDDARAVSCPACQKTKEFRQAADALNAIGVKL